MAFLCAVAQEVGARSYKADVPKVERVCRYRNIIKQFGFSKAVRLRTPADYSAVFERPIRSGSASFTVLAQPNGMSQARLGVIVAKRHARKAVVRNRVRRLIRESFRHHQTLLKGVDVVVLLRRGVSEPMPTQQVERALKRHWQEVVALWKKLSS